MLSQAVLAHYENLPESRVHGFSVTSISPCSYETYLNYHQIDKEVKALSAVDRLRMKNGNWQEKEILLDLKETGFELKYTGSNQITVHIGKAQIPGRPDGLIKVDNRWDLLEIKAMSIDWYTLFKQKGLTAFPRYRTQIQLYMASDELTSMEIGKAWEYVKHKDSCRPHDVPEEKDISYSQPIIEATDEIVLRSWEPQKPSEPTNLCKLCRHKLHCFKEDFTDTSGIIVVSLPEVVSKWHEGKFHQDYGKELVDEARVVFKEYLGDGNLMLVEDLKIQKILQKRTELSIEKFVEKYGAPALPGILVEKIVEQMRVTET